MYSYFIGKVEEINQELLVLEVNGIGYNIRIPSSAYQDLCHMPQQVKVYTYTAVREDAITLFGFLSREELQLFRILITVSGVGPKGALSILSSMSPYDLQTAIALGDAKWIAKAPGIGVKTAERVIIDLKDKLSHLFTSFDNLTEVAGSGVSGCQAMDVRKEALEALLSLGYTSAEVNMVLKDLSVGQNRGVEDIIKEALQRM